MPASICAMALRWAAAFGEYVPLSQTKLALVCVDIDTLLAVDILEKLITHLGGI